MTLAALPFGCASSLAPEAPRTLDCAAAASIQEAYLQKHVLHEKMSDELRSRAAESFIEQMDPLRLLLVGDEVSSTRSAVESSIRELETGDCTGLLAAGREVLRRQATLTRLAETSLRALPAEGFADATFEAMIPPEGWPRTADERNQRLARRIQLQLASYARLEGEQARSLVLRYYAGIERRAAERGSAELLASYLEAFASALDYGSRYLSSSVLEDFRNAMELSLAGLGVALSGHDGAIRVERVLPGGPAARGGALRVGDEIIAVREAGGEPRYVGGLDLREAVTMIRGREGTSVELTLLRGASERELVRVELTRGPSPPGRASLRYETIGRGGGALRLAIIQLPSFYGGREARRSAATDVVELVGRVTAEEADGLLLDLQQNGGGLLVDAIEIASIFLGPRDVVAVKKRDGEPTLLRADAAELLYRGPLVVLTSRESAAAAEIVAAALQDYRRAPIVGDGRTFGRGTVQSMVPLPRGLGAMKVTTAAFYRPGGGSPEEVGVTSDVTLPRFAEDTYRAGPAVPVEPIPPFGGEQANAPEGPVHVVSPHIVAELRARSRTRLASSNPPVAPTPELNLREAVEILADYVTLLATPEGG